MNMFFKLNYKADITHACYVMMQVYEISNFTDHTLVTFTNVDV